MKKHIIIFFALFALFVYSLSAQTNNIYQSGGISLTVGAPTYKPGAKGNVVAIDTVTGTWYISRDRYAANGSWLGMGDRIESISGCSAPAYTPNKYNSELVINNCAVPELYHHSGGGVWVCLNCASTVSTDATLDGDGSGGDPLKIAQQSATSGQVLKWNGTTWLPAADGGTTYTAGYGIDVTGTVISNTGDLSPTNELNTSLGVSGANLALVDAGGTLNVPVSSIAPVQAVAAGTGISISGTTTRTVSSTITQADGSETVVNAGTGISVSGTGTSGSPYVVSATSGGTDLSISGSSSPLTIASSTGTDVTATAGTGISLAGTSGNMTITNSAPSLWTDAGALTYLTSTGDNAVIGQTTQPSSAYKLQVVGGGYIKGAGATSATNALQIDDSGATSIFAVNNSSQIGVGKSVTLTADAVYASINAGSDFSTIQSITNSTTTINSAVAFMTGDIRLLGTSAFGNGRGVSFTVRNRNTNTSNKCYGAVFGSIGDNASSRGFSYTGGQFNAYSEQTGGTVSYIAGGNTANWGANASGLTITSAYGYKIDDVLNASGATTTNTYGYYVGDITTGTQTNLPWSVYVSDPNARSFFAGRFDHDATNTAAGTTGNQTINKPSGTVNIAAGGTTVTVTNSLVSATSIVFPVIRTNDTTATIKNCVPASGSFTINLTAAATAEISIGWLTINP